MGGGTIFRFYGGHSCYEGGHRAHGGPPSWENPDIGTQLLATDNQSSVNTRMEPVNQG